MNRVLNAVLSVLIGVSVLACIGLASSPPASAAGCSVVWLTTPTYNGKDNTGSRRCLDLNDKTNGWVNVYKADRKSNGRLDFIAPWALTKRAPTAGLVKANADTARWLARQHGVTLQFAAHDQWGRQGCTGKYAGWVTGSYRDTTQKHQYGDGLIRIGTGTNPACMRNRDRVLNLVRHEIAHALIERRCGARALAETRHENVTDAYAWRYLDATNRAPARYGFNDRDNTRAIQIRLGRC